MKKLSLLVAFLALAWSNSANASLLGVDPPANLIVTVNGDEWVWAAPCAPIDPSCVDGGGGGVLLHHGFQIPTTQDWNDDFPSEAALEAAFITGGQKCASPYFSLGYDNCDSGDVQAGAVWHAPWANQQLINQEDLFETFLIRDGVHGPIGAPEPASLMLLGGGLFGLATWRRKRDNL